MRYVTVCFYHSQLLITVQGRVTVLVFSFRLYITCCTVCSRFVFVCNFPSLHITAAILVTQSVWSKLHLHVLQLCTVCWQTAEMWLFAIPTWWVTNHSAGVRRNRSAMSVVGPPALPPRPSSGGTAVDIALFVFVPCVRDQEISVRYDISGA